jgi:hypothetical protein
MTARIASANLDDLIAYYTQLPQVFEQAASLAINDTVSREGMTLIKRDMRDQIAFPSGYLEGGRLSVSRKASPRSLYAIIRGRDRATSLARFAPGQKPSNTRGQALRVQVKGRGRPARVVQRGFLINLKGGNTGLAVRVKSGKLRHSQGAKLMSNGQNGALYLLYGPSVDQVLSGVADDRADDLINMVRSKFLRQFGRLARGR